MNAKQWMSVNLPKGKTTLSVDAVELLIQMAWDAAILSTKPKYRPGEIIGPYAIEELD